MGKAKSKADKKKAKADESDFSALLTQVGSDQDQAAFTILFNHFAPRIKSFLLSNSVDANLAEELAQEVMVTVWRKAYQYKPERAAASTWIYTIARNKKIDLFRKNKRKQDVGEDVLRLTPWEGQGPGEVANRDQRKEIILMALEDLPEEQAHVIKLAFLKGLTHKEIANGEDIPLGTVKSRIRLGLQHLEYKVAKTGIKPQV